MMRPMRRLVPLISAFVAIVALALPPAAAGAALPALVHLPKGTEAEALAVGPEGELWFAGVHHGADAANVSGRISGAGSVEEFPVPESGSAPGVGDLTLGPDGNMWFTETAAGRIDFEAPGGGGPGILVLPDPSSRPTGLATVGNSIWATLEATGGLLVTYPATASGEEYNVHGSRPSAIALADEGSLWLINAGSSELLRKPPAGSSITFPIPRFAKGAKPTDIVTGPEGNLWISQADGPYIARVEPEIFRYTRFDLPLEGESGFSLISNGPRHDIWFAGGGRIGSITNDGHWFATPTCALSGCPTVTALAQGPEGDLWFAAGGTVGRFEPPPLSVSLRGRLVTKGTARATTSLECVGGAAGQHCQGKLEMLPTKGHGRRLGSVRFGIVTGATRKVTLNLTGAAAARLARAGKLPIRLVARIGGKVSAGQDAVLRGVR
jgi:virginiamycin B lyase